jgi:manganese transport protein
VPTWSAISTSQGLYIAIGILGATVMPHNLYLHTSIVQTRVTGESIRAKKQAIAYSTADTIVSLLIAFFVNAAILVLAGCAFHGTGRHVVADIEEAYHLLDPIVGSSAGGILFAIALLASGQSSTFTGTIAGQVIMEGHLRLKIPCWKRRVITRTLALGPALLGVWLLGSHAIGKMLVLSQVVLSLQLPFAMAPLIFFTGSRAVMGSFVAPGWAKLGAWLLFAVITCANIWLIVKLF